MKRRDTHPGPGNTAGECIRVLDSPVFFTEIAVSFPAYTTPTVVDELQDLRSRCRYDTLVVSGLVTREPDPAFVPRVQEAAGKTGDLPVLSATDIDILCLALEIGGTIVTDDYAVQNVARMLGIATSPVQFRPARERVWKFRCSGCGRYYQAPGECPVCGAPIKRKLK